MLKWQNARGERRHGFPADMPTWKQAKFRGNEIQLYSVNTWVTFQHRAGVYLYSNMGTLFY